MNEQSYWFACVAVSLIAAAITGINVLATLIFNRKAHNDSFKRQEHGEMLEAFMQFVESIGADKILMLLESDIESLDALFTKSMAEVEQSYLLLLLHLQHARTSSVHIQEVVRDTYKTYASIATGIYEALRFRPSRIKGYPTTHYRPEDEWRSLYERSVDRLYECARDFVNTEAQRLGGRTKPMAGSVLSGVERFESGTAFERNTARYLEFLHSMK